MERLLGGIGAGYGGVFETGAETARLAYARTIDEGRSEQQSLIAG